MPRNERLSVPDPGQPPALSRSPLARGLYCTAGLACVGLGVLGIFLPLLPTTPFLLLAAACFARSSPRYHAWLLGHPRLGPPIRAWREHRRLPARTKRLGLVLIAVTFAISIIWVVDNLYGRLALAVLGAIAMAMLSRVPVLETVTGDRPGA